MGLRQKAKKYCHALNYGAKLPWYKKLLVWMFILYYTKRHTNTP